MRFTASPGCTASYIACSCPSIFVYAEDNTLKLSIRSKWSHILHMLGSHEYRPFTASTESRIDSLRIPLCLDM